MEAQSNGWHKVSTSHPAIAKNTGMQAHHPMKLSKPLGRNKAKHHHSTIVMQAQQAKAFAIQWLTHGWHQPSKNC